MSSSSRLLLLLALILGEPLFADPATNVDANPAAPAWAVSSAPAKWTVALDQSDKPAPLVAVDLALPDPRWAGQPIRVFTDTGVAVGSDLLWTAPGEPATLLFDSAPGAKHYDVYLGSNWPAMHLQNTRNGVVIESRAGDGKPVNHLNDLLQAWNQSPTINGRAIVDSIFEGGNRFGPEANAFIHFRGWFNAPKPEHLELALIANDSAFIQVDGKDVVGWAGAHDFRQGLGGQFQGAIDLAPGPHALDYYNSYIAVRDHPLVCCLAVRGGPFTQWTMLTPNSGFFLPFSRAHPVDYALQSAAPSAATPAFGITWTQQTQSVIAPDVPDLGFIKYQFTCLPQPIGSVTWNFDDGTTAQGDTVSHLFPRPGLRRVQLLVKNGNNVLASVEQTVSVHPNWIQLSTFPPQLIPGDEQDIAARDPTTFSVSDLAGCAAVFGVFKDASGLLKLGPALCAHARDFSDADLPYLRDAARFLAEADRTHPDQVTQILNALITRAAQPNSPAADVAIANTLRLSLAEHLLKFSDRTDEIKSLLDAIDPKTLSDQDPRRLALARAFLSLATGDVTAARKQFEALTGAPSGPDARSSIRTTAEVGRARVFIGRGDFEGAQDTLGAIAWQYPINILSPDWALAMLQVYEGENLTLPAYLWAKRMLPVITDEGRSELLFRLADLAQAQGDADLQKKVLTELLQKHPYSEEAAKAKQKWPGLLSQK